ncbi:hypothetical protein GYMLUDRAFT_249117 [Collybiopsis luxurians FD-317 M1]|uniref:DUF6533 domain-containing protein n=1 Tax=Collybiopsis luxurians FD-317 M1 TaxID=944289 RepID=A0A0D0AWI4_9AGAR|nr:hypothetical protein GYMLUDRAFT_249117 [Collybiopsis luxurians FD-317 M1]
MRAVKVSQWNPEDAQVQMYGLLKGLELISSSVGIGSATSGSYKSTSAVILIYDWLITLDREVELFWRRDRKRLPAILFFVNRYLSLLGAVPISILYFWPEPVVTHNPQLGGRHLTVYLDIFLVLLQVNLTALFILRVTALYGGSRWIKMFLSVLGVGIIVNGALGLADRLPLTEVKPISVADQIGNVPVFSRAQGMHFVYLWAGVFVFDLSVFSLTVWKTASTFRNKSTQCGIVTTIMRDGLMYFGIITLTSLANVLVVADLLRGLLTILTDNLSCVLMSRMMFNLREDNSDIEVSPTTNLSSVCGPILSTIDYSVT